MEVHHKMYEFHLLLYPRNCDSMNLQAQATISPFEQRMQNQHDLCK